MTKRSRTVSMDSRQTQQSFASAIGAVSIEIWSNGITIFFTVKPKRKFPKQNKTKNKAREEFKEICRSSPRQKLQLKNAASCRLSSEFEGDKNGLSPVQQKSKIPVCKGTHLNNNSGNSSSSKEEVDMKQHILRDRAEKKSKEAAIPDSDCHRLRMLIGITSLRVW